MRLSELEQTTFEGVNDSHIFKAVFMAGAPGAGKTTVAKKLLGGTSLKPLNVDRFWQLYRRTGRDSDYSEFWDKYQKQDRLYQDGRLGLLIDGTAKNPEKMVAVKRRLEELGYETAMVFVNTDLQTSIRRVRARADSPGPDQGRQVPTDFIKDSWHRTQAALGSYQSAFGSLFFIVDNSDRARPSSLNYAERRLRAWLNTEPTSKAAREWIQAQQDAKRRDLPPEPVDPTEKD